MEYRVSSIMGNTCDMKKIILELTKEVTIIIRNGGTLVGGVSVSFLAEDGVCVSQAYTFQRGIVDNLI